MNDELERVCVKVVVAELRNYSGTCPEGLKKTTKSMSRIAGVPESVTRPEYESRALPLRQAAL
jgi:hypothetical protein